MQSNFTAVLERIGSYYTVDFRQGYSLCRFGRLNSKKGFQEFSSASLPMNVLKMLLLGALTPTGTLVSNVPDRHKRFFLNRTLISLSILEAENVSLEHFGRQK